MMERKPQKKYQASQNYIHRKIADSDVLISVGSNIANFNGYIEMNKSAVALWEALQAPCQLDELEKVLEDKYGITHENAVEDVLDFINLLQEHDMVMVR
ncbi:MAG: PqqD family protein [Lachnospiraceae bacterium]|nr:PqqD family protein [Lachnospiraceae bacterium]